MPKFFIHSKQISGETIRIDGPDFEHIIKVRRSTKGDTLTLSDENGFDYTAQIQKVYLDYLLASILDKRRSYSELDVKIHIYQALPKGSKMEFVIQKNVELGAVELIPCVMSRCIVKLDGKEKQKQTRWQKISEEAAKQSGRAFIPRIAEPMRFSEAVQALKEHPVGFAAYEGECPLTLKQLLRQYPNPAEVGFLIGPEGGFSQEEIDLLNQNNIPCVTLGARILRTETAAMAVTAAISYEYSK